jgi:acid phosphatase
MRTLSKLHLPALCISGVILAAQPASAVPALDHVIVVVMENKGYPEASAPPYTASLIASSAQFPAFYAYYHPSQPNYLVLWSGDNQGVTTDACPAPGSPFMTENLGHACEVAGKTWRTYAEDLPGPGSSVCFNNSSLYVRRHCPWTYFGNLNHANERPFSDLATDIANQTLPNLAFVMPNNHNNTHDSGYDASYGDAWLANNLPAMINAVGPNGIVVLTWDEDDGIHGNRVLTVIHGAWVIPGYVSTNFYLHWNLIRTICDGLGIAAPGLAPTADPIEEIWLSSPVAVSGAPRGSLALSPPVPNPSHGAITARLSLPAPVMFDAAIYDLAGRVIRHLEHDLRAGEVELRWDGRREDGSPAGAGVYLLRVRAGTTTLQRKALLVR